MNQVPVQKACPKSAKLPVLFIGHGSPMNAIENNSFTESWSKLGQEMPKPSAILSISAHWETKGTHITVAQKPQTIHDFGGFPKALFEVEYSAQGCPELAYEIKNIIESENISLVENWGLDHGTWSILNHLYPAADVPVIQLSLDYYKTPRQHVELAKELALLRRKGVLIIGSGNIVHNLRMIAWDKMNEPEYGYDWAIEANNKVKSIIESGDFDLLCDYKSLGPEMNLAIPSPDHFLPLLYILALKEENEEVEFFNDQLILGSLSMLSMKLG
ncbi:MAG: 4,5-DOPA dioxygenase extradiol [Bacteroidales bacterium]|nr:4,5-DOPA dioxygenase extradiol [Bacteroidales bacterium]